MSRDIRIVVEARSIREAIELLNHKIRLLQELQGTGERRFCQWCDSKGFRHTLICSRPGKQVKKNGRKKFRKALGNRPWTKAEHETLLNEYRPDRAIELAQKLGRSKIAVIGQYKRLVKQKAIV